MKALTDGRSTPDGAVSGGARKNLSNPVSGVGLTDGLLLTCLPFTFTKSSKPKAAEEGGRLRYQAATANTFTASTAKGKPEVALKHGAIIR